MRELVFLLLPLLFGTDPVPLPVDPVIVLPVGPVIPTPMPQPLPPAGVYTLNDGESFVINCKQACRVKAFPANLVTVSAKTGPRDITGRFAGGKGVDEDRSYPGPFIYIVKANGKGKVELEVIPFGFKGDAEVVSTSVDVNGGLPIPPTPTPDPKPPVPVDPLSATIQDTLKADKGTTADLASLIAAFNAQAAAVDGDTIKTSTDLFKLIHDSTTTLVGARLETTRKAFGGELGKVLPSDPTVVLSKVNKSDAKAQLTRFAAVLEGLK